jgi:hypothetical protein
MDEAPGLFPDGRGQAGMRMSDARDRDAAQAVEVALSFQIPEPGTLAARERNGLPAVSVHQVLHGLTRPGVFTRSEKAHGGKKPPCVLLKMLGFTAAIFIRIGMWMQAFSPAFGPARALFNTCISCGTLWVMAPAFDSLVRL